MKLPALLAIGLAVVIGLGVYFLKSPALLLYPAAWGIVGAAFWGLNKSMRGAPQPPADTAETSTE